MDTTVGGNKKVRRAYGFDEVALVPGPLVIDPRDVDISWTLGNIRFD
ncbi:MAG: GuaB3 family IMP dehydrogenase-related protein, partial [Fibrella sp.]|nr:GuaB3 family IMP dehydrogenase-related protein [Armatimonadota bacterium]